MATLLLGACGGDNHAPAAVATASSMEVGEGLEVQLSASGSSDPDGDRLSYLWRQTEGPAVTLSDARAPAPTFTVPVVGSAGFTLAFEVVVSDEQDATCEASVEIQARPLNFLVIITDDQTVASSAFMPTLQERVVGEGTWFENAFVTTSLCCPSRSSFLTGLYAHNHGVLTNTESRGGAGHFDDTQTIGVWLRSAGYRTGFFGKYLNGYSDLLPHVPPGWDRWVAYTADDLDWQYDYDLIEDGIEKHYGHAPEDYSTDVVAREVLEFLDEFGTDPFLVWFTPHAPHADFVPTERHRGLLENEALPHPPNFYELDVSDKPDWVQELSPDAMPSLEDDYPRYLETLLAVDEALAGFMDRLDELGALDRTVIIFTSDNGLSWGEHRWTQKQTAYEENVRVPLAIRFPTSTVPRRPESPILNIDLAPTIAELAGVQPGAPVDGVSYAAALRTGAWDDGTRSEFLIENYDNGSNNPPEAFGIRTPTWKYIEYKNGERELYDLVNDPFELDNAVDRSADADMRAELESHLQDLLAAGTGDEPLRVTMPESIALPPGLDEYVVTLTASGGAAPYLWQVPFKLPLPPGSTLSGDGTLTVPASAFLDGNGAPTRVVTIGVRVEDQTEGWDCARIVLSIAP